MICMRPRPKAGFKQTNLRDAGRAKAGWGEAWLDGAARGGARRAGPGRSRGEALAAQGKVGRGKGGVRQGERGGAQQG